MTGPHHNPKLVLAAVLALCLAALASPVRQVLGYADVDRFEPLRQGTVLMSVQAGLGARSEYYLMMGRLEARDLRDESDDDVPTSRFLGLPTTPPPFELLVPLPPRIVPATARVSTHGAPRPLRC